MNLQGNMKSMLLKEILSLVLLEVRDYNRDKHFSSINLNKLHYIINVIEFATNSEKEEIKKYLGEEFLKDKYVDKDINFISNLEYIFQTTKGINKEKLLYKLIDEEYKIKALKKERKQCKDCSHFEYGFGWMSGIKGIGKCKGGNRTGSVSYRDTACYGYVFSKKSEKTYNEYKNQEIFEG